MVETRDLSNQTQLWGGTYFPDLSLGVRHVASGFRRGWYPVFWPYVLLVKATQKLTPGTKVSAASGEPAGAGRCRSSSSRLFRVQMALGWVPVPGWAHRLSPCIPDSVLSLALLPTPSPAAPELSPPFTRLSSVCPHPAVQKDFADCPVMFHCEGFTGRKALRSPSLDRLVREELVGGCWEGSDGWNPRWGACDFGVLISWTSY